MANIKANSICFNFYVLIKKKKIKIILDPGLLNCNWNWKLHQITQPDKKKKYQLHHEVSWKVVTLPSATSLPAVLLPQGTLDRQKHISLHILSALEQLVDNFMKCREAGCSARLAWVSIRGRESAVRLSDREEMSWEDLLGRLPAFGWQM